MHVLGAKSMGFSRRELAELTGYGERTIAAFEAGEFAPGKPVDERTMRTYRLACASISFGVEFDWSNGSLNLGRSKITIAEQSKKPNQDVSDIDRVADKAISLYETASTIDDDNLKSIVANLLLYVEKSL